MLRSRVYSFIIMLLFTELCFSDDTNSTILSRGVALAIPEAFSFLSAYNTLNWNVGDKPYIIKTIIITPAREAFYKSEYINGMHSSFRLSIYQVEDVDVSSNAVSIPFQNEASMVSATKIHEGLYTTSFSDRDKLHSIFNKLGSKRIYLMVQNSLIDSIVTFFSTLELFIYDQNYGSMALLERENDIFDMSILLFLFSVIYPNKLIETMSYANALSYYSSATYRVSRSTVGLYFQEKEELVSFNLIYSLFLLIKFAYKYSSLNRIDTNYQILFLLSLPYFYRWVD